MRSSSRVFTWSNGTICSKIDRALVNEAWMREFHGVEARFEAERLSDHSPILVNLNVNRK